MILKFHQKLELFDVLLLIWHNILLVRYFNPLLQMLQDF